MPTRGIKSHPSTKSSWALYLSTYPPWSRQVRQSPHPPPTNHIHSPETGMQRSGDGRGPAVALRRVARETTHGWRRTVASSLQKVQPPACGLAFEHIIAFMSTLRASYEGIPLNSPVQSTRGMKHVSAHAQFNLRARGSRVLLGR